MGWNKSVHDQNWLVVDILKGSSDIQRDLGKLEKWAGGSLLNFSNGKRSIKHQGWSNIIVLWFWVKDILKNKCKKPSPNKQEAFLWKL